MTGVPQWVRRDLDAAARLLSTVTPAPGEALDDFLYRDWYIRRGELEGTVVETPPVLALNLVGALQAAHHADGRWDRGWTVERVSNRGRVAVGRQGRQRVLDRIDVLPDDPARAGLPLRPGDRVRASARVDGISADGGFWVTFGDGFEDPPSGTCVRYYWAVGGGDAAAFVDAVTRALGGAGVPYSLKLPVEAAAYGRADAAVLYLPAAVADAATRVLREVHRAVAGMLRAPTPRLAFRLAPGVAVAEDPPTGESFGQHRCRLVAEAASHAEPAAMVDRILERFRSEGIDHGRPYANPGSTRLAAPWS